MATPDEVQKALMTVMPLFANYRPPEKDGEVKAFKAAWHRQVGHLDCALLNLALADAAGKSEFFPTPKSVLDSAARITMPTTITGEEAWANVVKQIHAEGYLHPPRGAEGEGNPVSDWTFKDARTLAVVKSLGWRRLCLEEDETIQWQFIHAYKALAERETTEVRELPPVTDMRHQIEASRETARVANLLAAPLSKNG